MAAPAYTPASGPGTISNGYVFTDKGDWQPLSQYQTPAPSSSSNQYTTSANNKPTSTYSVSAYFGGNNTPGYKKYQEGKASGKWKDLNDFIKQGGQADGSSGSYVDRILKDQKKLIEEETKFLDKYTKENPFAFDEELAKQSATAEYEPYYTELYQDYLSGVELKRESIQDDQKLLTEMKRLDEDKSSRAYNRAISQAEEGFAGSGLFFSGIKDRATGEMQVENQAQGEERSARYGSQEKGLERGLTGLDLESSQRQRDLQRGQQEAVEGGILQRKQEALTQYYTPLVQTYQRRFGGSSQDVLSGYLPPEYLRY